MLFQLYLRTRFLFLPILTTAIAPPCQQKRDTSLDLFSLEPVGDEDIRLTLAFTPPSEPNILFTDNQDSSSSIFHSPVDELGPVTLGGSTQIPVSDSTTEFSFSGGTHDVSELLFPSNDPESVFDLGTTENLVAELPHFGGITDFLFKDPEDPNLCRARDSPATQSDKKKLPGPTGGGSSAELLTEQDLRKCPARPDGSQPVPLCCFSAFVEHQLIQYFCWSCK